MPSIDTGQSPRARSDVSRPEAADVAAGLALASAKDRPAVRVLGGLSDVGDQPPLLVLCGAVLAYGTLAGDRHAARAGARMLGALLAATAAKSVLKRLVTRPRPHLLVDERRPGGRSGNSRDGDWHSFPSGHTAGAVAVARALGRVYPDARPAAYAAAAAIGLVQVPRGGHYPADVAAGALVGLAAEAAVDAGLRRLEQQLAASVPRARALA